MRVPARNLVTFSRRYGRLALVAAFILAPLFARAASLDQLEQQAQSNDTQIQQLQNNVNQKSDEAATLQGQIAAMQAQADALQGQINDVEAKIELINARIDAKKKVLDEYIRQQYYNGDTSDLEMLYSSDNFSQFMDKEQYLQAGQTEVQQLIKEITADRKELDNQKAKLDSDKNALAAQQKNIADLLAKTQGEEASYQALLNQANAQQAQIISSISAAVGSGGAKNYGFVVKGQVIGYEGSTGNSTGPHLHFTVISGGAAVDPNGYLNSGRVSWPLDDFTISQGFGCTSYSFEAYDPSCPNLHFHNGIDMSGPYGEPVHAAASGTIVDNGWQPYGFGHYIIINHGGFETLYGHLQQ